SNKDYWSASHKSKEALKMHPFIHQHQSAIAELCRRYRVQRLEVFGSAARGTDFAPESSDADFLVEFSPSADSPTLKAFFGLQADLSQILGRTVDLAESSALRNPYVQASVNRSREVVYAA
ncbi:MAG: nucleotidyltransferase family protein, partial [Methylobacter sp.]|nr:nucleotidyltransferase family protein [Methylobacter sp.]